MLPEPPPTESTDPPAPLAALSTGLAPQPLIEPRERVTFFPTFGHRDVDGLWHIHIHGCVHRTLADSRARKAGLKVFRRALGLSKDEVRSDLFMARAAGFIMYPQRRRAVMIELDATPYPLGPTGDNGHVKATLILDEQQVRRAVGRDDDPVGSALTYRAAATDRAHAASGSVHLLGDTGVSVISDIDDTIKVSRVASKRKLLANTFLRPFRAVSGIAGVYAGWAEQGAAFHYVSASPWQLADDFTAFLASAGLPAGTFHLKLFRWRHTGFFSLFSAPRKSKRRVIEPILQTFPHRRFVLVGDSGERDPEAYGSIARQFPDQIAGILIRNLNGQSRQTKRYLRAFEGLPHELWRLFEKPDELPQALDV